MKIGTDIIEISRIERSLTQFGDRFKERFLHPQEMELVDDMMVVTSEHSEEKFLKPDPLDVKVEDEHVVISTSTGKLVFLERAFDNAEDYRTLKSWLQSGPPRNGETGSNRFAGGHGA